MKNFIVLFVFCSTTVFGSAVSFIFDSNRKSENYPNQNVVCFSDKKSQSQYFTLQEANDLLGKKVFFKNEHGKHTGKIISFEMIETDKFLIEIYSGKGVEDENYRITFHDKKQFENELELIN